MSKKRLYLTISSILIWIPVLDVIFSFIPLDLSKAIVVLMYIPLLICPILSFINIIVVIADWYKIKTLSVIYIFLLLSNILFLTIGMMHLREIAWLV